MRPVGALATTTLLFALSIVDCQGRHVAQTDNSPASSATPSQFPHKFEPVASIAPAMTDLAPWRRTEVLAIQNVLKPRYRDRLQYTFDTGGVFVVILPNLRASSTPYNLTSCHTPAAGYGEHCLHDCSGVFEEQFWEAVPMMGSIGRCLDNSSIWLPAPRVASELASLPHHR